MLCGISEVKMAVLSNVFERGKQKFDDTGIKKSLRWGMDGEVVNMEKLSLFMRKILSPGVAYCNLCRQEVSYCSRGKVVLEYHVRMAKCKSTLRAELLQRKQSRVPYLASSQQSGDTQFWK